MITNKISVLNNDSTQEILNLSLKCFNDDMYYQHYSKTELKDMFETSINICLKYGYVYGYFLNSKLVGFIMGFNYKWLKDNKENHFNLLFPKDILQPIDNIILQDNNCCYLLTIGVDSSFRRQGIATELVKYLIDINSTYNIFSDVSNKESIPLYENLGFEIVGNSDECIYIYLKR